MNITSLKSINNNSLTTFKGKKETCSEPVNNKGRNALIGTLMALASIMPISSNAENYNSEFQSNDTELVSTDNKKEKSIIEKTAEELNYTPTANKKVYYDSKKQVYYMWNDKKQKFEKAKKVSKVYPSGYLKTKDGEYLRPDGSAFVFRRDSWNLTCNLWNKSVDFAVAEAKGYKATDLAENLSYNGVKNKGELKLFYNPENKKYYTWSYNNQDLVESPVTDVTDMYYTKDNKHYKVEIKDRNATTKEVSEEEYQASKQKYRSIGKKGVYRRQDNKDYYYYQWIESEKTFKPFGDNYDKKQMLVQKADGKIGDFRQGEIGDCWLLGFINGMNHHPDEVMREKFRAEFKKSYHVDENGNETVILRGPNRKYTYSKEDIDSVLNMSHYHYSIGDRDVVAIEMAVEEYKREMRDKGFSPRVATNIYNMQRRPYQLDDNFVLDGGQSYDAIHLVTGKESHHISDSYQDGCVIHDNVFEIGKLDENLLKKYLNNYLVLVSYKDNQNDDAGHVVVLTNIDDKNVYVIDSNIDDENPDKSVHPIARNKDDFMKKITSVTYTDFSKQISPEKAKQVRKKYVISPDAKKVLPPDFNI